jgi:hypothetical protein
MRTRLSLFILSILVFSFIPSISFSSSPNLEIQAITDSDSGEVRLTFNSKIARAAVRSYQITATPNTPSAASYSKTFTKKVSGYVLQRIPALTPGTDYKFRVSIRTTKNRVINSAYFNFYTRSIKPTTPLITRAFETDSDEAVVYFDAPANDGQTPVLYYTAKANPGNATGTTLQRGSGSITISGLTKSTTYTFTVTAHNINGASVESKPSLPVTTLANKIIRVAPASSGPTLAAPAFTISASAETKTVNNAITGYTIDSSGGGTVASYSISPPAPAGLTFDTSTGRLTGTPTSARTATAYTITATNASGSATRTFTLTVSPIVYTVGQTGPGGGIIFYYNASPFACGITLSEMCNYLEAHSGVGSNVQRVWTSGSLRDISTTNSTGTAIGTGRRNTAVVVAAGATDSTTSAVAYADQFISTNGTSDWFLPSKDEMQSLSEAYVANSLSTLISLSPSEHWTSSQSTGLANQVWVVLNPRISPPVFDGTGWKGAARFIIPIRAG